MEGRRVFVKGVGRCFPGRAIPNHEMLLACRLQDATVEWCEKKIGIKYRHCARITPDLDELKEGRVDPDWDWETAWGTREGCHNSQLSAQAVQKALEMAELKATDLQMIIHCSCTPDYPLPSTATLIQEILEIPECNAVDIRAACSGSTQGLQIACMYIKSGFYDRIAVIGCDVGTAFGLLDSNCSHFTSADKVNACLIGDGAAAVVLCGEDKQDQNTSNSKHMEVLDVFVSSIGPGKEMGMWMPAGGSRNPCCKQTVEKGLYRFNQDYKSILQHGPELYLRAVNDCLKRNKLSLADIDLFIPHQANGRVADIADTLGFPKERIFMNFERVGNTANGSLLICLDEIVRDYPRMLQPGALVMMVAAESSKWLYGATLLRYDGLSEKKDQRNGDESSSGHIVSDKYKQTSLAKKKGTTSERVYYFLKLFFLDLILLFRRYWMLLRR
eukprot:TRINITY_DN4557_c0_g1_i1.p1 TRINITY_DN4557_c0_g1~~TRINITY_DN4557_c0_g1_i1.p1  ORF type:complete len:470 (-),score=114.23 TRINITY_DN4557_c0_g1_i1:106-1437(-)